MASTYSFIDAMYQHLSAKKHTVSELTLLKKLGYRHNEMTAYLSTMNDMQTYSLRRQISSGVISTSARLGSFLRWVSSVFLPSQIWESMETLLVYIASFYKL